MIDVTVSSAADGDGAILLSDWSYRGDDEQRTSRHVVLTKSTSLPLNHHLCSSSSLPIDR